MFIWLMLRYATWHELGASLIVMPAHTLQVSFGTFARYLVTRPIAVDCKFGPRFPTSFGTFVFYHTVPLNH